MSRALELPAPGVSGSSHLRIPNPESRSRQHPYAVPTDVSLTLPPLAMSSCPDSQFGKNQCYQFTFSSGIPSPPHSESSRAEFFHKEGSASSQDNTMAAPSREKQSPSYPSQGPWTSSASHPLTPTTMNFQAPSYDMTLAYHTRQGERQDQHQNMYYTPQYCSSAMPAPSQLLGSQLPGPSNYLQASRAVQPYQQLPRPVNPTFNDYSPAQYAPNYYSGSVQYQTGPNNLQRQSPACSQPYCPSPQSWTAPSKPYKPPRERTIHGVLSEKAWKVIFRCLNYQDRLRLRSVNHFFKESLDALETYYKMHPDPLDLADKVSLVTAAENYRKHWSPQVAADSKNANRGRPRSDKKKEPVKDSDSETGASKKRKKPPPSIGNLGCYYCFKVLPGEEFCLHTDDDDPKTAGMPGVITPRRYCLRCGIRKGYHQPMRHYERKVGGEIWVCQCLRLNNKGVMDCVGCGKMCPLTSVRRYNPRRQPPPKRREP